MTRRPFALAVLWTALAWGQAGDQATPRPEELRPAPAADRAGGPAEAGIDPAPDAEKAAAASGYVEVRNPAFPAPAPPPPVVHRGRRFEASDLAPYFAEGSLAAARAEFEADRYAHARALLEGAGDAAPVRYLRALSALRAGDDAFAAAEFERLATDYPPMRDRALTHAALAHEEMGELGPAAALYAEVRPGSRLYSDARLGLSRVHRALGQLDQALDALAPLLDRGAPGWGRDVAAEALSAAAALHRQRGAGDAERATLVQLWSRHPLSPAAEQAGRRLDPGTLPVEARVARGEALVEAHRNRQGLAVLQPLARSLELPAPLACRAHFAIGKALRKEREHPRAIRALTPVVEACQDPELRPRALYVLASSRSIAEPQQGPATYEQLVREYPAHTFADDALFYAADLYLKNGAPRQALERLEQLATAYPDGDFAAEALFKAFWIRRQQGDRKGALEALDRIEATYARSAETYEVERARYWRGRLEEDLGEKVTAQDRFEALASDHPATYYGLLARVRLAELDGARADALIGELGTAGAPSPGPWPLFAGPMGEDPRFQAGLELLRMGFHEAASSELLAVNRVNQPAEAVRLLVLMLSAASDPRAAHAVARSALRSDLSGRISRTHRAIWEVAYPNAFRPLIERHSRAAGFDPDLLQALMREESALDPRALSWAGALGLTQLMPSTARAVARELKVQRITTEALLDPDLNIKLGAAYLGRLVRRFGGELPAALASYNAGAAAVDRWRAGGPRPLDEWVEEIPISETRGYVKRVLRTYNTYQLLYGRSAPSRTLTLPAGQRSAALAPPPAGEAG